MPTRKALFSPPAIALFLLAACSGLASDLLSKHYVFQSFLTDARLADRLRALSDRHQGNLSAQQAMNHSEIRPLMQRQLVPGVKLTLSTNPGVVFGLPVPRPLVAVATIGTLVLVLFLFATSDCKAWSVHLALAFVLAGAIGNFYDRLLGEVVLPGVGSIRHQVRDFIDCSDLYYPWVFNVADALVVVGVGLLVLHWLLEWRRERATSAAAAGKGRRGN